MSLEALVEAEVRRELRGFIINKIREAGGFGEGDAKPSKADCMQKYVVLVPEEYDTVGGDPPNQGPFLLIMIWDVWLLSLAKVQVHSPC